MPRCMKYTSVSSTARTQRNVAFALMLGIVLLGAGLRLYGLDTQSLWNDELSGWRRSSLEFAAMMRYGIPRDHPPGFQIFLYGWIRLVGDTAVAMRLPPAWAGTLAVPGMYWLGRRLYGLKEGVIAAALTAVLWCPIYYSQEARANSMLLLLAILSTGWLLRLVQDWLDGRAWSYRAAAAYVGTAVVAAYLHYYGLLLVVCQALAITAVLVGRRRMPWRFWGLYAVAGAAYVPWLPRMWRALGGAETWMTPPGPDAFWAYLTFLFNNSVPVVGLVVAVTGAVGGIAVVQARDKWRERLMWSPGTWLLLGVLLPFALVYLISIWYTPLLHNRSLIILLPAVYLLFARALARLPLPAIARTGFVALLMAALLWQLVVGMAYYRRPRKQQFREAVALVVENATVYKNAIVIGYAWSIDYFDYYFIQHGSAQRTELLAGAAPDIPAVTMLVQERRPAYVWFLRAHRRPDPVFASYMQQTMRMVFHQHFVGADVWLFATGYNDDE